MNCFDLLQDMGPGTMRIFSDEILSLVHFVSICHYSVFNAKD